MDTATGGTLGPSELTLDGLRTLGPGTTCDVEPIHLSGSVQPRGFLLAVDPQTMHVGVVSANLPEHLGRAVDEALGAPLASLLTPDQSARLLPLVTDHPGRQPDPVLVSLGDGERYEAVTHRSGTWAVLELERVQREPRSSTAFHDAYRAAMDPVLATLDLPAMCARHTDQVRALTGFERVVVYRFDDDGHGSVIAESLAARSALGSLVGLHYPAGDIPRQARALFLTKRVRVISDALYEPVPLVAAAGATPVGELDLTLSDLRSVSPFHLQYLRDMGIAATMSISIVCGDRLWGMVLCHHREPRTVRHTVRRVYETLVRAFALQLEVAQARAERDRDAARNAVVTDVVSRLGDADSLTDTGTVAGETLLELVGAEAVVVRLDGQTVVVGPHSVTGDADRLVDLVLSGAGPGPRELVWTSTTRTHPPPVEPVDSQPLHMPHPVDVLTMRLPRDPTDPGLPAGRTATDEAVTSNSDDAVLWVRVPRFEVRTWAGPIPRETAGTGPASRDAATAGHPRQFDPRDEVVRDTSARWTSDDLAAATALGRALPAGLLRRSRRVMADHDRGFRAERAHAERTRRQLERQLQRKLRLESLGRLAGGVAHDFNNLLTVVLGHGEFVEDLAREAADDSDDSRWAAVVTDAEQIISAARRAALLTRQLLAFARREVAQSRPLDLNVVLSDLTTLLERTLGAHVALRVDLTEDSTTVLGSTEQLERVFVNLAVNARDAMPGGGTLTITTEVVSFSDRDVADGAVPAVGRYVRARVQDTGQGIPAHVIDRVFDPFFTTKTDGDSSGLGLATAHGIVDEAGGRIDIRSERGVGTTVTLLLPVTLAVPAAPAPGPVPAARDGEGRTVLVVDDEPAIRAVTTRILQGAGYRVLAAADGPQAIDLAGHGDPIDVLITDVVMPGLLGKDVAAAVRSLQPQVAVLFVSGFAQSVATGEGTLEPEEALLDKPFTSEQLLRRVSGLGVASRRGPHEPG